MKRIATVVALALLLIACGAKENKPAEAANDSTTAKVDSIVHKEDSIAAPANPTKDSVAPAQAAKETKPEVKPADKKEPVKPQGRKTVYGKWVLESLNGVAATKKTYTNGIPYINIDGEKHTMSGFGGCNKINGDCNIVEGSKLQIEKLISTKMFCQGVPENELLALLRGTHEFSTTGDKLMIKDGGAVKAIFFRPYE